jgi:hypothetical protein
VLAGNAARTLVILPFNVTAEMPREIESLSPLVWRELELYLTEHSKRLKTLAFPVARTMWIGSIRAAQREKGDEARFDDAARIFVRRLAEHAEFDAVIVPTLYVKAASVAGRTARWDGVEQPIEIEVENRIRDGETGLRLHGEVPAASIHTVVLDAGGDRIHEGQGGLDLLVAARVLAPPSDFEGTGDVQYELATRTDLFSDREHVRAGIARALAPFLPELPLPEETG